MLKGVGRCAEELRLKRWICRMESGRNASLGCVLNKPRIKGVNLQALLTVVIFSEPTVLTVLRCQSFPVKQGAAMISFYFGALQRSASAVTDRVSRGRLKIFWTATDTAAELTGIICCITRMIITEREAAVKFRWLSV